MAFQKEIGLTVDGIVGPYTWQALCKEKLLYLNDTQNISS